MSTLSIEKPFVIWTLQRSGGTNLANYLDSVSANEKLQDEAFNRVREYGYLTKNWKDTKDSEALMKGMQEVCALNRNVKHCVERVPWAVSNALLESSVGAGFNHLFLYRQDPVKRLLSMEYAERTRSWGPKRVLPEGQDADAFVEPLNTAQLIEHEEKANIKLNKVWSKLGKLDANRVAISYEELYAEDASVARKCLKRVLKRLAGAVDDPQITAAMKAIRSKGNQKTSDRYAAFKGIDELSAQASNLPQLVFRRDIAS